MDISNLSVVAQKSRNVCFCHRAIQIADDDPVLQLKQENIGF